MAQPAPGDVIGQINATIDGEAIVRDIIAPRPDTEGGVMVDWSDRGGLTELDVAIFGLPEGHPGRDGSTIFGSGLVLIELDFESGGAENPLAAATPDTLVDGGITVIDDWPEDDSVPVRAWLADLDDMDSFNLEEVHFSEGDYTIIAEFTTSRLCLFDEGDFDLEPVLQDGVHICRDASVQVAVQTTPQASIGATTQAAPDETPTEVEILGRIEGTLDGQTREWITIFSADPQPSATAYWSETPEGGPVEISIQGHDPESEEFLSEGVLVVRPDWLSQEGWTNQIDREVRAEILYVVEADGRVPTLLYTSEDSPRASGSVRFEVLEFASPFGDATGRVTGTVCRVERAGINFQTDPEDCLALDANFETEIRDGAAGLR